MKYVLAISGGVDSVVLLDLVARDLDFRMLHFPDAEFPRDFVVAHFEHGVRGVTSVRDAEFVRGLADKHNLEFALGSGKLGRNASEELARKKRHKFLQKIASENNALIVTAHHADDLFETIVMNLIRGTGWRGLAPMTNEQILRPLLDMTKAEIVRYAIDHDLMWAEDATNFSFDYFRNRVREFVVRIPNDKRCEFLELNEKQRILRDKIENEIPKYPNGVLPRQSLTTIPENVAVEILRVATDEKLTRPQLKRLLTFIKTAKPHKRTEYGSLKITVTKTQILFN